MDEDKPGDKARSPVSLTALVAVVGIASSADAAAVSTPADAPQPATLEQRIERVRQLLLQTGPTENSSPSADDTSTPPARTLQWANWPNWPNWPNWNNWVNWNNWNNWVNWWNG